MSNKFTQIGNNGSFNKPKRLSKGIDDELFSKYRRHTLIKNWRDGNLWVHVHMAIRGDTGGVMNLNGGDYCALFENPDFCTGKTECVRAAGNWVNHNAAHLRGADCKSFVLVPIIDSLKHKQISSVGHLNAVVRLQPSECCSYSLGYSGKIPRRNSVELISTFSDREINFIFEPGFWFNDSKSQVIKSRAKIVSGIANNKTQLSGVGIKFIDNDAKPPLSILLERNSVKVFMSERGSKFISGINVFASPREALHDGNYC